MLPSRIWSTFLWLAWIAGCQAISKCQKRDVCSCESEDGIIDLRPLDGPANSPTFTNIPDPSGGSYIYSYNPCTPFDTQNGCHLAAVCQVGQSGTGDYLAGIHSTADFNVSGSQVEVTYVDDPNFPIRTSSIRLKCDPKVEKNLVSNGENPMNHYIFTLTTKYACFQNGTTAEPYTVTSITPTFATSPLPCHCHCGQWLTAVIILCVIIMLFLVFLIVLVVLRLGFRACSPPPKNNTQNAEGTGAEESGPYGRIM